MPGPITAVITSAVAHAPNAVATATLKAAQGFLAKVVGPAVEEIGETGRDYSKGWRAKNSSQTLAAASNLLVGAGRAPQAVPLKTWLPLLDVASLEEAASMAVRWASPLANAANPARRVRVQPGFSEVLQQLTSTDVQLPEPAARLTPTKRVGGLPRFGQVTTTCPSSGKMLNFPGSSGETRPRY